MDHRYMDKCTKIVKFSAAFAMLIGTLSFTSTVNASSQGANLSVNNVSPVQVADAVYYSEGAKATLAPVYYRHYHRNYGYRHYGYRHYGYRHYGYRHYRRW